MKSGGRRQIDKEVTICTNTGFNQEAFGFPNTMTNKDLPKPAKIAATNALTELQFTQEKIAEILDVGKRSVERYQKEETPETWREFGEGIKKIVFVKEEKIAAKALSEIEKKMPEAKFFELVGLYKTIRELQQPKGIGVATQVNVFNKVLEEERKEFNL